MTFIQKKDELEEKYSTTLEHSFVNEKNRKEEMRKFPAHWERYEFAKSYVHGKKVLDVACASGYGTDLLTSASGVPAVGLDIDEGSIKWASHYFGDRSSFFKIEKEDAWPVAANSVDVVVSFETIEHVKDPNIFLSEIYKALKPGGILVISTPLNETEERFSPANEFHVREYSWEEFTALVGKKFLIEDSFSQISNLGEIAARINKNPTTSSFKRIVPKWVRRIVLSILSKNRKIKSGKFQKGFVAGAAVQLRVAKKVDK